MVLDLADPDTVNTRTDGVTASFLKELLRKAALFAAEDAAGTEPDSPLRVTDAHMTAALDQMLDTRNQLTRVLLGGHAEGAAHSARGTDAVIRHRGPAQSDHAHRPMIMKRWAVLWPRPEITWCLSFLGTSVCYKR